MLSDDNRWRVSLSLNRKKKVHQKIIEKLERDAGPGEYADLIEKIVWAYYFGTGAVIATAPVVEAPAEPEPEEEKEEKAETDLGGFML